MRQLVLPIKDTNVLHEVEDTLLHNSREGRRNYTIFQVSKAALFRMNDALALRYNEIYKTDEDTKRNVYIHDKETGRSNILYLKPVKQNLINYFNWLNEQNIQSE